MEFQIEALGAEDWRETAELIHRVHGGMPAPEWYLVEPFSVIEEQMRSGRALVYGAREAQSGELAGILLVLFPGLSEENLGWDAGMRREEVVRTAVMDSAAVRPEYRGYHLQTRMAAAAESELEARGFRHLTATVHPENRFSRESMERLGYRVVKTAEKYGGHLRHILRKDIGQ